MLTGTNLTYAKRFNLRIVHETIRLFAPLSRTEVARRTELTLQTVSNLVRELIDLGLVLETERRSQGRGAPSTALSINPEAGYSIGFDLDHDHLTAVLVDLSGTVRRRFHFEREASSPDATLDLIADTSNELLAAQGVAPERVWGIGIGLPGPMYPSEDGRTYTVNPKALPGWKDVPIAALMARRLPIPVFVENNATGAAVGERWYGQGKHLSTFFYVYLGSGLGGGLVVNGHPFEGRSGNAGELGFLPRLGEDPTRHAGDLFNLGRLFERLGRSGAAVEGPADLGPLFEARHPALTAWLGEAVEQLAYLLLSVEYILDPEAFFFGGRAPNPLLASLVERTRARMERLRVPGRGEPPLFGLTEAGADAVALGVATLPVYDYFAPAPRVLLKQPEAPEHGRVLSM